MIQKFRELCVCEIVVCKANLLDVSFYVVNRLCKGHRLLMGDCRIDKSIKIIPEPVLDYNRWYWESIVLLVALFHKLLLDIVAVLVVPAIEHLEFFEQIL